MRVGGIMCGLITGDIDELPEDARPQLFMLPETVFSCRVEVPQPLHELLGGRFTGMVRSSRVINSSRCLAGGREIQISRHPEVLERGR